MAMMFQIAVTGGLPVLCCMYQIEYPACCAAHMVYIQSALRLVVCQAVCAICIIVLTHSLF